MDSNGSIAIFTNVEELPDNGVVGCTPIYKEQIVMLKPCLCETPGIIHFLIESDDSSNVVLPEVRDVGLRSVQRVP